MNEAFTAAVERYRDMVHRIAYSYMRNPADADDVAQDAFIKLFRSNKKFESDDHLRYWLVRVTVNQCKSLFRKPWQRTEDIEAYAATLEATDRKTVNLFVELMQLPEKYRVPIILHYYVGLSAQETAEALGIPATTARTRLARRRAKLRKIIEEEDSPFARESVYRAPSEPKSSAPATTATATRAYGGAR